MEPYTIISAHLATPKKLQKLSNAAQFTVNNINIPAQRTNTIRCRAFNFLRLNKSIPKKTNIIETNIIINCNNVIS
jgi:hypothetical protein